MIQFADGVARLTCHNNDKDIPRHPRGWLYDRSHPTPAAVREFARAHGWSTDQDGRDLCPTCTRGAA